MLVRPGFEPTTSRMVVRYSTNWANRSAVLKLKELAQSDLKKSVFSMGQRKKKLSLRLEWNPWSAAAVTTELLGDWLWRRQSIILAKMFGTGASVGANLDMLPFLPPPPFLPYNVEQGESTRLIYPHVLMLNIGQGTVGGGDYINERHTEKILFLLRQRLGEKTFKKSQMSLTK